MPVADSSLLEAVHSLPEESQQSVLRYALFLRHEQEEQKWDERFSDPQKMTRFDSWAKSSLKENPPQPMDFSKL